MPRARILPLLSFLVLSSSIAAAHHSFTRYDGRKLIVLKGVVSSVSYSNPHVSFSLDTTSGTWRVEAEGVPVLKRAGITDTVLANGAKATVSGWRAKDGTAQLGMKSITIGGKSATTRRSVR